MFPPYASDLPVRGDFWVVAAIGVALSIVVAVIAARRVGCHRRWASWLPIALPIATAALMLTVVHGIFERREWRTFDAELWKADGADDGSPSLRSRMARDVVDHHRLDGLTRAELIARLGNPTDLPAFAPDLAWRLGMEQGLAFGVDQEWLIVALAADGRAASVRIRADR